jgi:hypothetical protein
MAIKKTKITKRKHGKMQKGGSGNTSKIVEEIQQEFRLGRRNSETSAAGIGDKLYTHVKTLTPSQIKRFLLTQDGERRRHTPYFDPGPVPRINYEAFTPHDQKRIAANAAQQGARASIQPIKGLKTTMKTAKLKTRFP